MVVPIDKVLESTAKAEDRIGKSGAVALNGVATLTSTLSIAISDLRPALQGLGPAVANLAAVTSEARGIAAGIGDRMEDGWLTKRLMIGVIIAVAVFLLHSVLTSRKLHRRVVGLHDDVRRHITREPPK